MQGRLHALHATTTYSHSATTKLTLHLRAAYIHFMNKKSPQIVGLGPPVCSQIFGPVNFNANQLNVLVHLPLL